MIAMVRTCLERTKTLCVENGAVQGGGESECGSGDVGLCECTKIQVMSDGVCDGFHRWLEC
jgi:hypothetical protein